MATVALYNIKGGVGKTAAAVNLAYLAACDGAQTILFDLDPQGSAAFYFRIKPSRKLPGRKFLRGGRWIEKRIRGTDYENLDLMPSNLSFRNLDTTLSKLKGSTKRLHRILKPYRKSYDFIFLDCPPGIGLVSENMLFASDVVLVPCIPTTLSMRTYDQLVGFFDSKGRDVSRIYPFFAMVEKRKRMHSELLATGGDPEQRFLKTRIPYASEVEKMGIHREPVPCFAPGSPAADAYQDLWNELKGMVPRR